VSDSEHLFDRIFLGFEVIHRLVGTTTGNTLYIGDYRGGELDRA